MLLCRPFAGSSRILAQICTGVAVGPLGLPLDISMPGSPKQISTEPSKPQLCLNRTLCEPSISEHPLWKGVYAGFRHFAAGASDSENSTHDEDREAIDRARSQAGFKRSYSGAVFVRCKQLDEWLEAKLDSEIPGAVLFRGEDGTVYYLVSGALQQIDLSNDLLVGKLFANSSWEKAMQPLLIKDDKGVERGVQITKDNFHNTTSMMKAVAEMGPK